MLFRSQTDPPIENNTTETMPDDTVANETLSNTTDVEPSAEPVDPTEGGTDTAPEPNATYY